MVQALTAGVAVAAVVIAGLFGARAYRMRRRTTAALETMRKQLQHVLACAPAVIYTAECGGEQTTTFLSDGVRALLGYAPEVFVGKPGSWISRVHPDDREAAAAWLASIQHVGRGTHDYRFRHADGRWRWMREEVSIVYDGHGRPREIVGYWADVTERRELEERVIQGHKLEAIGTLASGIAHDFNNLLMGIIGVTDIALDRLPAATTVRPLLLEMRESAQSGTGVVRQLLDFARKGPREPQRIEVDDQLERRAPLLRRLLGVEHTLELTCDAAEAEILVDPSQLDQAIVNLVVNARHAMPEGGTVTVESSRVHVPAGDARGLAPGDWVKIVVRDQGVGMDAETRSRAFEPFFSTRTGGQGTGLGLSMVYGVVRRHGGEIELDSTPDVGTEFRIWLPCVPPMTTTRPGPTVTALRPVEHASP